MRFVESITLIVLIVVAIVCVGLIASARAEIVCQTTEDGTTYCWDSESKEHTTCQTSGGYTYCH